MARELRWIDRTETLAKVLGELGPGPLAVDTEADSLHRYPEKVCLIQLTAGEVDYLVEPLGGADPRVLESTLADPGRTKIFHGADYDVRLLHRDFGLRVRGLFDTMIAARLVGETAFGLAALLKTHFDVVLDKRLQRADWSQRPLTPEMREYAAMDTRYLEDLAGLLTQRLESMGRLAWAREEFEKLETQRWAVAPDPDAFRRVRGSGTLKPRELAVLRELHALREREARRRNRPPFRVLRDENLWVLARERPGTPAELNRLGLPRFWGREPGIQAILEAMTTAESIPEEDLPPITRRERRPAAFETRLKRLCRRRDELARELGLEAGVLAPRAALAAMLENQDEGKDPADGSDLRSWQREIVLPLFVRAGGD